MADAMIQIEESEKVTKINEMDHSAVEFFVELKTSTKHKTENVYFCH